MAAAGKGLDAVKSVPPFPDETNQVVISIRDRYDGHLHRFLCRRLDSLEDVREMMQEIYLRITRYARHTEVRHPRAFLFRTARNLLKDHARRLSERLRDQHIAVDEAELACPYPTPDDILQSKQVFEEMTAVLEGLRPQARRAFILHRFRGLKYSEIATEMGISKSMVNHHISTVLERMHKSLRGIK